MRLDDITFFQPAKYFVFPPFRKIVRPSKRNKSFLAKLLNDNYFQEQISQLRKKYGIPQEGYNAKWLKKYKHSWTSSNPKFNGVYDVSPLWKSMKNDIAEIVKHYHLDRQFIFYFSSLVTHNAFINLKPENIIDIKFEGSKDTLQKILQYINPPVGAIIIRSDITKEQLKNWIDDNWDTNEDWLSFRYNIPKIPSEKGTYKNVELDIEIAELKTQGLSYKEISDLLTKKYPDNDNIYDPAWIKTRFSRYSKKKIKIVSPLMELN